MSISQFHAFRSSPSMIQCTRKKTYLFKVADGTNSTFSQFPAAGYADAGKVRSDPAAALSRTLTRALSLSHKLNAEGTLTLTFPEVKSLYHSYPLSFSSVRYPAGYAVAGLQLARFEHSPFAPAGPREVLRPSLLRRRMNY